MTENTLPTIRVNIGGSISIHHGLHPAFIVIADAITTKHVNISVSFSHKDEEHKIDVLGSELTTMQLLNSVLELFSQNYPFMHKHSSQLKKSDTDCYDDFFLDEEWLMLYMDDKPKEPFWCIHAHAGVIIRMEKHGEEDLGELVYHMNVHSLKDPLSLYGVLSDPGRYSIPICGGEYVKFGHLDYYVVRNFELATSITSGKWLYHMRTELKPDQGPWMIPSDNVYAPVISANMLGVILGPMGFKLVEEGHAWPFNEVPAYKFDNIPAGW